MDKISNLLLSAGGFLAASSFLVNNCTYTVNAGERAIIFDRGFGGIKETIYGEGMHFVIPFLQSPIKFEIRIQPKQILTPTGTKDLQTVDIGLRILHRPVPEFLPSIYTNIGRNYDEKILPSIGNEVLKATVAQYDADQLLKQREQISLIIKENLTQRAKDFNIILDDVSITHIGFMKEYANAIEQKQVAQQNAERSRYIVLRNEQERDADIIKGEGEAAAALLINNAVKTYGKAYVELKKLQAAEQIAKTLSTNPNVKYIPQGSGGNLLNLQLK